MKTKTTFIIHVLAVLAVALTGANAPAAEEVVKDGIYSCVLKIDYPILADTTTQEKIVRNLLGSLTGTPPNALGLSVGVDFLTSRNKRAGKKTLVAMLSAGATKPHRKKQVQQFLSGLCAKAKKILEEMSAKERKQLEERLASLKARLMDTQKRFKPLQAAKRDLIRRAGFAHLSPERILNELQKLEEKKHLAELDLAEQEMRMSAMRIEIARISAKERSRGNAGLEDIKERKALLEADEKKLKTELEAIVKKIDGSPNLFAGAHPRKDRLARMKATETGLSNRIQEIQKLVMDLNRQIAKPGKDALALFLMDLNARFARTTIDVAGLRGRLGAIQERLAALRKKDLPQLANEFADLTRRMDVPEEAYRHVADALRKAQKQFLAFEPTTVTIVTPWSGKMPPPPRPRPVGGRKNTR